ncbi:PKD-like family lipoprotein [Sphingobacterium tabacisoli]|uniref:PKD-like family lipoprotein n=2 Tax=Sphingobacterium tabacisoli TaxID=2044855 RepID=A0ABW5KX71_9SPHI
MKMKNILGLLLAMIAVLVSSCHKDGNSYDYKEAESISVEGLEQRYNVISEHDTLRIDAMAHSTLPDADFEYVWGVFDPLVSGTLDTIGRSRVLEYRVKLIAGNWILVHIAKNKKTGLAKLSQANIRVNTKFTTGWYVLKDDEQNSDLDFFYASKFRNVEWMSSDIYSAVNGRKLEGKAGKLSFVHNYKSTVEKPKPSNTPTLFVNTTGDIQAVYLNTLKVINTKETFFLGSPSHDFRGDAVFYGSMSEFLINNGRLYGINMMNVSKGMFGTNVMFDSKNSDYTLSPFYLPGQYSYFFDTASSTFVTLPDASGTMFTKVQVGKGSQMDVEQNNQKVHYMGLKNQVYLGAPEYRYEIIGYAIFEDKSNPSRRVVARLEPNFVTMKITRKVIQPTERLFDGKLHTLLFGDEEMMYFVATDGNVYSRNLANSFEQLQYTVSGGGEVTFIKHLRHSGSVTPFNYVAIGVKQGGSYKVMLFEKVAGDLKAMPEMTLEGEGSPRDVMYIDGDVSADTYKPIP